MPINKSIKKCTKSVSLIMIWKRSSEARFCKNLATADVFIFIHSIFPPPFKRKWATARQSPTWLHRCYFLGGLFFEPSTGMSTIASSFMSTVASTFVNGSFVALTKPKISASFPKTSSNRSGYFDQFAITSAFFDSKTHFKVLSNIFNCYTPFQKIASGITAVAVKT